MTAPILRVLPKVRRADAPASSTRGHQRPCAAMGGCSGWRRYQIAEPGNIKTTKNLDAFGPGERAEPGTQGSPRPRRLQDPAPKKSSADTPDAPKVTPTTPWNQRGGVTTGNCIIRRRRNMHIHIRRPRTTDAVFGSCLTWPGKRNALQCKSVNVDDARCMSPRATISFSFWENKTTKNARRRITWISLWGCAGETQV